MYSIILAAGKGTRMGDLDRPKVCLELEGVPVILRALELYTRCGIEDHVVVVGDRAEEVQATVRSRFPRAHFAPQPEQHGTGHAARCGAAVLEALGYDGEVLIVVGDRVLKERALRGLLDHFRSTRADLCLTVGAKEDSPDAGRIVEDEAGNILANVEVNDVRRAQLIERWFGHAERGPLQREHVGDELLRVFVTERKAKRAMPRLWCLLEERTAIQSDDLRVCFSPEDAFFQFESPDGKTRRLSGDEIEARAREVNLSVYCFRTEALRYALARLTRANAQGEEYLTDAIAILAAARTADAQPRFRVTAYRLAEPTDAMTYNTPAELQAIREHYRALG